MEKTELIDIINKCYKAVNESVLGEIVTKKEDGSFVMNTLPMETYRQLLASELPHINISTTSLKQSGELGMELKEPGDTWKK